MAVIKRKLSASMASGPPEYEALPPYQKIYDTGNEESKIETVTPKLGEGSNPPTSSKPLAVKEDVADLVSAAEALTQLTQVPTNSGTNINRVSTPTGMITQNPSNITSPLSNMSLQPDTINNQHPLVARVNKVSRHPLVTNAVKYYDYSKRNYAPFNYAAEIVEKAAIPVVNKIEVNLNTRYQASQARKKSSNGVKKRRIDSQDNVSIETKKRLQFCLHILRLANDHINNLVNTLQQRVASKELQAKEKRAAAESIISESTQEEAQRTKTEIVTTVKKIIKLISNFKPSSLSTNDAPTTNNRSESPDLAADIQLKSTIRDIILTLPATVQQAANGSQQANDRVLVFAKESLDMISRLTTVFNEQLEKAEAWVAGDENSIQQQENDQGREKAESEDKEETGESTPSSISEKLELASSTNIN